MKRPSVVMCGEALIDMIQQPGGQYQPVAGGSPTNTATALARWGNRVALVSRIGNDGFGDMLRRQIAEAGVDLSLITFTKEPTTLALASLDVTGAASYSFYIDGCADGTWSVDNLPEDFGDATFCVVAGSLALPTPRMAETFDRIFERESHRIIVFDPNIRPLLCVDQRDGVVSRMEKWVSASTIVKASSEDLSWSYPGHATDEVARKWLANGPRLVAITDGMNGAHLFTDRHSVSATAPEVSIVDTVGAGDTFTAGLVDWLIRAGLNDKDQLDALSKEQLESALDAAITVASDTCTRQGADPPWKVAAT